MRFWNITLLFGVAVFIGCDRSPYELAPVRGKVTIDGRAFNQGRVMFAPSATDGRPNPGKPAFALLKPDGSFVLGTYAEEDGAVVGDHTVTIIRTAKDSEGAALSSAAPNWPKFSRLTVPKKWSITADQENECDIELTSADVRRLGQHDD